MLAPLGEENDLIDEIIDILMQCTYLVEFVGEVRSKQDVHRLRKLCWRLESQTDSWYERLRLLFGDPLYTSTPDDIYIPRSETSKQVYPDRYHFQAVEVAEAHSLYWAGQLIIYSLFAGLEPLQGNFTQHEVSHHQQPPSSSNMNSEGSGLYMNNAEFYADQICRGVGYFIQPDMHILGGHNLLFPVSMAAQFFHGNGLDDKYKWCQEVFIALESIGLGLSHVLQGTPWSKYKSGEAGTL